MPVLIIRLALFEILELLDHNSMLDLIQSRNILVLFLTKALKINIIERTSRSVLGFMECLIASCFDIDAFIRMEVQMYF